MMLASGTPDEAGSSGEEPSSASLTRYEARQARSAELKNRRRITKALAAKRSRAQHCQYVSQLTEEAEGREGDAHGAAAEGGGVWQPTLEQFADYLGGLFDATKEVDAPAAPAPAPAYKAPPPPGLPPAPAYKAPGPPPRWV